MKPPEVARRAPGMWLSHRDCATLIEASLTADVGFAIVNGVSDNHGRWFSLDEGRRLLGWAPQDGVRLGGTHPDFDSSRSRSASTTARLPSGSARSATISSRAQPSAARSMARAGHPRRIALARATTAASSRSSASLIPRA